jgi:hypothetical protein
VDNHPGLATAFVTFDGIDGSIKESFNVSNVNRTATGTYTIEFENSLSHVNYAGAVSGDFVTGGISYHGVVRPKDTSACYVIVGTENDTRIDRPFVSVILVGG